jgi:hypothetical protein
VLWYRIGNIRNRDHSVHIYIYTHLFFLNVPLNLIFPFSLQLKRTKLSFTWHWRHRNHFAENPINAQMARTDQTWAFIEGPKTSPSSGKIKGPDKKCCCRKKPCSGTIATAKKVEHIETWKTWGHHHLYHAGNTLLSFSIFLLGCYNHWCHPIAIPLWSWGIYLLWYGSSPYIDYVCLWRIQTGRFSFKISTETHVQLSDVWQHLSGGHILTLLLIRTSDLRPALQGLPQGRVDAGSNGLASQNFRMLSIGLFSTKLSKVNVFHRNMYCMYIPQEHL